MKDLMQTGRRAAVLVAMLMLAVAPAVAQDDAPAAEPPATPTVEVTFGTGVDRATRALTGEATAFSTADFSEETGQVFCFTRIQGLEAPATVTHAWYYEGKTMARKDLNVGSADWRTWSSKRIMRGWTGTWEVKVLDANGMVLASSGFEIN